jgi:argininosuccinate lyase
MPHKQNPDVLELIRASYHQLNGYEWQMKALPANLISGYHRDMQLTKEPLMRGLHLTRDVIAVSDRVIDGLVIHSAKLEESMTEELSSVRKAIELVKTGMPFRDAYHQISKDFRNNQG